MFDDTSFPPPPEWSDHRTFFLEPEKWREPYVLEGGEAHHLIRVLRIRQGEEIRVLDGRGREGVFLVRRMNRHTVDLELRHIRTHPRPDSRVILAAGWTKAARRGWILEKAVELQADAVISVGQAGGRNAMTPEVIGINLRETAIADNAGRLCSGEPIDPEGPDGIFSTLPVREMVASITGKGIPAKLSYSAGAYVCNDVLYTLLQRFEDTPVRAGFIHVPFIPGQGEPNMVLSDIVAGLEAAIAAL